MRKLVAFLSLLVLPIVFASTASAQSLPGSLHAIPTPDGFVLNAYVSVPAGQGNGPFPVVVMPSSWGLSYIEYVGEANVLASKGYIVVSYSSRGFDIGCALLPSCGYIDIAGPLTVNDVSTVIDWALANTPANSEEIGVSGISYGAGTSLLAAENDPRIKVVAALSGWSDLAASLDAYQTPSAQGITLLSVASYLGKPGPLMQQVNQNVTALNYYGAVQAVIPVAGPRDPLTNVAQLNKNGTAVFLANAFEDSLFVPSQIVDFYNDLSVPKHLMLAHGDHATNELLGAVGFPNEVYDGVTDWFDHYLKGVNNGIDSQAPVQLKSQTNVWSTFANWNAVQAGTVTYNLTSPNFSLSNLTSTGGLSSGSGGTWSYSMTGGVPTLANSGLAIVSGVLTSWDAPPTVLLPLVARTNAAVWTSGKFAQQRNVEGTPEIHISVTPSGSNLSLFTYLYSVNPSTGLAQLMSEKPYTLSNAKAGVAQNLDIRMEATNWEVDAGQQLALVIGTVDLRYAGVTPVGSKVIFGNSTASPSTLTVALH